MTKVQIIQHGGRPVAAVIGEDKAVISDSIPRAHRAVIQRMCLFALEITAGERPGPYRDEDAARYARR